MSEKHSLEMESIPHDVVERIMERLDVKPLLRFKAVSKQWKSTIESRFFQERQLIHRQQSGHPDLLMLSLNHNNHKLSLITLVLGSSSSLKVPIPLKKTAHYALSQSSCDGLVCLYDHQKAGFVINPTTRWYRPLPPCLLRFSTGVKLGFGKDKIKGTYKPVLLYNSLEMGLPNATTCQVFDFSTNSWRYVTPSAPYRVLIYPDPVFVDGSLHWFTQCKETKILSFDLHTEVFRVISKAPFANVTPCDIVMCNLDNRLCVSKRQGTNQVIWSFNLGNKTWDQMCSIALGLSSYFFEFALTPLTLLDEETKKKKLWLYFCLPEQTIGTYDLETKSCDVVFSRKGHGHAVCYFQSLISSL